LTEYCHSKYSTSGSAQLYTNMCWLRSELLHWLPNTKYIYPHMFFSMMMSQIWYIHRCIVAYLQMVRWLQNSPQVLQYQQQDTG